MPTRIKKGLHYNHADGIIFAVSVYFCQPSESVVVDAMEKPKVLVIDDDPGTCSLLELVLEIENYQPASRRAIEQGDIIALLNQENPDFLILDLHLGSEDALKYIRSIRSHPDWQDLAILATSAIDHRRECMAAGTDEFILKPFNWEEVVKKIKQLDDNTD